MSSGMELHHAIYQFYLIQIRLGIYGFGEKLPALEEVCRQFHISLDTVKPAYHRLRQEGYISISQKAGAKVIIKYKPEDMEQNIQTFYAKRRETLMDFINSMWPLLGEALCHVLKCSYQESVNGNQSPPESSLQTPNITCKFPDCRFHFMENGLFIRLLRYLYLYFFGSFCGVLTNSQFHEITFRQMREAAALGRNGKWNEIPDVLRIVPTELCDILSRFYEERISMPPASNPISLSVKEENVFHWDTYKKSSQLRYSLAMELLTEISQDIYPVGSYLPSAKRLSSIKGVSVSTVRRAVCLLNSIGVVKSSRPLGARVLPSSQVAENCDFTHPDLRRRLLELAESLQIFALSGKTVSYLTLESLDEATLCQWRQYLYDLKRRGHCERVIYASLSLISAHVPLQTLRTVYSELLNLLFWGYPLERIMRTKEEADSFFIPFYDRMLASLEQKDYHSFSSALEYLLVHELSGVVNVLLDLGIKSPYTAKNSVPRN